MNLGLLLLRLLLAALLFGHASQKLFGWFRGQGPTGTGATFHTWGFRPGRQMALLAGLAELAGAALIALGLATPLGAAIVLGTMVVAASVNLPNGLWAHLGGYEVAFVYGALAVVLAYTGPGAWSLDHLVGLDGFAGYGWGTLALAVGLLGSVPPLLRRRRALAAGD
ncbi:DoxX family protein [Plantactinospora sp. ZYX-F-223]|uniref:DoxX family protein n=1 Tax=Plantactinospora sp. ZYX-F-223 TaxID=3144103 RepID=UPI0031FC83B6